MNRLTPREGVSVEELGVSDCGRKSFAILDNKRPKPFLLVVGRVNEALLVGRRDRQIVRFSKREHSPHLSDEIWVSTLAHYRKGENLEGDQCDPMEGRVKLDATPFFAGWLPESGFGHAVSSLSAKAEHGLICDPWVYCTAFCPYGERDAYGLGKRISSNNDTITNILDVNAFALELGVGFAVTLDPATHLKAVPGLSLIEKLRAAHSEYKRIVHVDHGPVAYEDVSGTLDTSGQPAGLSSPAGFIKPKSFSYQAEYRFALQIIGEPSIATLRIPVSDALRECTSLR